MGSKLNCSMVKMSGVSKLRKTNQIISKLVQKHNFGIGRSMLKTQSFMAQIAKKNNLFGWTSRCPHSQWGVGWTHPKLCAPFIEAIIIRGDIFMGI